MQRIGLLLHYKPSQNRALYPSHINHFRVWHTAVRAVTFGRNNHLVIGIVPSSVLYVRVNPGPQTGYHVKMSSMRV